MAMNATLDSSKANRRFIILAVVLGLLGAVLVYVAFSRDTSSGGNSAGGASTAVVVARVDIAARTKITTDMLEVKLIPQDAVSEFTFADPAQVVGQVTRFPITANQQVLSSQVIATSGTGTTAASRALSYTIPTGKRAFAVSTNTVAGAGGLILPGDYIDVLVVYQVEGTNASTSLVQTLFQNIEVLAVSQVVVDTVGGDATTATNGQRARNTEAKPDPAADTYTLLLDPDQVQKMYLAETAGQIRFALRSFGDGTEKPVEFLTEQDLIPDTLP